MKKIHLTQGQIALVDDTDYESISRYNWYAKKEARYNKFYALRSKRVGGVLKKISMHRQILKAEVGVYCDHVNGDTLDNRRQNLRICTQSQNIANRPMTSLNTSGFKGVYLRGDGKKFVAVIGVKGNKVYLGSFSNKVDAAKEYNKAALDHFGEFAFLNDV